MSSLDVIGTPMTSARDLDKLLFTVYPVVESCNSFLKFCSACAACTCLSPTCGSKFHVRVEHFDDQ